MKSISKLICMIGLAGLAAAGNAQVYTFISEIPAANQSIPDDNTVPQVYTLDTTWWNDQVNTMEGTVSSNSFRVYLDLEGDDVANNGDLYVTLTKEGSGLVAMLINRPGRGTTYLGYGDNGLNVTLFDGVDPNHSEYTDIHWYREDPLYTSSDAAVTGTYKSDGRSIQTSDLQQSLYMSAARDNTLAVFEGINPNGTWYLSVADLGGQGLVALKSWGLDFTPIPEPQQYAMVVGAGLMAFGFYRNRMRKSA